MTGRPPGGFQRRATRLRLGDGVSRSDRRYNPRTMKHLLRILLNAATVSSLVLCVVAVTLWVRSYFAADILWHNRTHLALGLHTSTGIVRISARRWGSAIE